MTRESPLSRRQYIQIAGATGAVALAGCAEDEDPEDLDDDSDAGNGGSDDVDEELEIVHWWTAGSEEEAFNALVEGFEEEYDEYGVEDNPAPGGAGAAIDAEIQTRVLDQDPPGTFQIWPGEALRDYLDADTLEPVADYWDDEDAYVDGVLDAAAPDGDLVIAPINIHRLNNVFYNTEVLDDAGVDPDDLESPEDLLEAFEAVDDAGYVGLAQQTQEPWGALQFWEMVFIGQHGVDAYEQFLDGEAAELEAEIEESLEFVEAVSEYHNEDAGTVAWDEANNDVITGDAAFHHNGDWAAGEYQGADDFEYGDDWDYMVFPGTEGMYAMVMDGFVYPSNNPTPDATEAFISYCTTTDAQERFNPHKGSIPPRTDVPTDDFPPFLQDQMDDFESSDQQTVSISHGSGLNPAQASEVEEAFAVFTDNWDVDETTQELVNIF
ncbi:ABC transporter substrate-binding protein [Natronolimnobius baerhuensis]|uniref:Sugar ABC transporter substrate-binding protein n=1 Tax=Natronolimnobius baerhuensis TaxID=253108 RepID=A0A202E481_9EURY|nr:ABC transporter substrate-binding protein [Natronolimnobius baerhuensis]OVE83031.1 sugar ABC transporter substrate-binding protein [Natronolimnobius baerhuensis]